ncbi:gp53-like domain-containing protein [Escherichia coli]|uniref:gp53-like domain-containing protein n=1 Tax=Escherichia coli TaxID=562 RepID=UPI00102276C7
MMPVSRNRCIFLNVQLGEAAKRNIGSGEGQIPDMSNFQSGYGWFKLPSGDIIQAFGASFDANGRYINFPIPFPSSVTAIVPGVLMSAPSSLSQQFASIQREANDLTRFFAKYNTGGMNASYFIAIGK